MKQHGTKEIGRSISRRTTLTGAYDGGAATWGLERQVSRRAFLCSAGVTLAGTSFLLSGPAKAEAAGGAVTEADRAYESLAPFLLALCSSGGLGSELRSVDETVLIALTDPDVNLFLELHPDGPTEISRSSSARPGVVIRMSTTTAQDLFSGQDNWFAATARGSVTMSGSVERLRTIAPRVQFASPIVYQAIAAEENANEALAQ